MFRSWPNTKATIILGIKYPIVQAPMTTLLNLTDTIISTPEMVAGVSNSGGLGQFGAGLLSPNDLRQYISRIKTLTNKPFAVNLLVPGPIHVTANYISEQIEEKIRNTKKKLETIRKETQLTESENPHNLFYTDRPGIETHEDEPEKDNEADQRTQTPENSLFLAQIEVILEMKVQIVSFAFGVPEYETIQKLRDANVTLIGTATTVEEALYLQTAGIHLITAQGYEAGGHRGTFLGSDYTYAEACIGNFALIPQMASRVAIPILAAGGIMNGNGVVAALVLGASAVVMGTAFLASVESGASPEHKASLLSMEDRPTILTRSFTGKPMRVIMNGYTDFMGEEEHMIPHYPVQHKLTLDVMKKGIKQDNNNIIPLLAGQGYPLCKDKTCKEIFSLVVEEVESILGLENETIELD